MDASGPSKDKAKGINLLDSFAVKRHLDEVATEAIIDRGYLEDVFFSNVRIAIGLASCGVACLAQFYPQKFPANVTLLMVCIGIYILLNLALQFLAIFKEKNHILFTHPKTGSYTTTGLAVSSKLPRFSSQYTLRIGSSEPNSVSARPAVEMTRSITEWFTGDGILAEKEYWKAVEQLLDEYEGSAKKRR
ncbi:microsomal signal peptidase complex subunit [Klebsormidium nitens]|uniref:Signal peptidase complex subunit 2 n=1 Tax=Klebsormidium nitens TaxID=105231 RepID=A0A1Y1HTZ6_KLENI|nr:microsomal signal peptidase complex subunit [Klebsormidium nitens]|eukprot:GAQ81603.1 microsomal signal peptidase complex subunit [Klebsormidium nitens]